MKQLFIIAGIIYAAYFFYSREMVPASQVDSGGISSRDYVQPPEDPNVVMYSLTTCEFCKKKARELADHNIAHVEYFIDVDEVHEKELNRRINESKMPIRAYGTPIFAVYGEVIPNNPSIEEIQAAIARHRSG